jgi:hypothetical protein
MAEDGVEREGGDKWTSKEPVISPGPRGARCAK